MTLTIKSISEFKALFGEIMKDCVKEVLSDHGVTPERYPAEMTIDQVCAVFKCSSSTVYKNWRSPWRLELYRGKQGSSLIFKGVSVKRCVDRLNAEKGGKH